MEGEVKCIQINNSIQDAKGLFWLTGPYLKVKCRFHHLSIAQLNSLKFTQIIQQQVTLSLIEASLLITQQIKSNKSNQEIPSTQVRHNCHSKEDSMRQSEKQDDSNKGTTQFP
ncbi:hypothetical protein ABPG74_002816 [Tetrahymena malaccensis]